MTYKLKTIKSYANFFLASLIIKTTKELIQKKNG